MMIGMALFWGAIILGLVWLFRDGPRHRQPDAEETAPAILDRRFAEGALSIEDYHQRKSALTGSAVPRLDQDISPDENERS